MKKYFAFLVMEEWKNLEKGRLIYFLSIMKAIFLEIVKICLNEGCVLPLDHGKVVGRTPASFLSLAYLVGKSDCKRLAHLYHMVYITVF